MLPSERLCLVPHPLFDPCACRVLLLAVDATRSSHPETSTRRRHRRRCDFGGLRDLHFISRREGYQGGMRLLQAACKRFLEYCVERGIALPKRNFTLSYETNVPRQVGLAWELRDRDGRRAGAHAFYALDETHIPVEILPNLVLSVEAELGINAGLTG